MEPINPLPVRSEDGLSDEELSAYEAQKLDVEKNRAVAAVSYIYLLSLVALYARRDSRFTQFHARQGAALFFLALICLAFPLFWLRMVLEVLLMLVMAYGFVQANQGRWTRIPLLMDLLERPGKTGVVKGADTAFVSMKNAVKTVTRRSGTSPDTPQPANGQSRDVEPASTTTAPAPSPDTRASDEAHAEAETPPPSPPQPSTTKEP